MHMHMHLNVGFWGFVLVVWFFTFCCQGVTNNIFIRFCHAQELFSVQSQYQMQEDLTQIAAASELRKLQDTAFQKSN